jgi:endoplasmic reticulum chaperone BiP
MKRPLGRTCSDVAIKHDSKYYSFTLVSEPFYFSFFRKYNTPMCTIKVSQGKEHVFFKPEEILAKLLKKTLQSIQNKLNMENKRITSAVITVSTQMNDTQIKALKKSINLAGLELKGMLNDAAASVVGHYYAAHKSLKSIKYVLVFDMGSGTFKVSVMGMKRGIFGILASKSHMHLGGIDFTHRIMKHFIELFIAKHGTSLLEDKCALFKMRREAEYAKIELSVKNKVQISIDSLHSGIDFNETLTRDQFNKMNMDLFEMAIELTKLTLKESELNIEDIHEVLLVGASTLIPKVNHLIRTLFSESKTTIFITHELLNDVGVFGASYEAAFLSGSYVEDHFTLVDGSTFRKLTWKRLAEIIFGYIITTIGFIMTCLATYVLIIFIIDQIDRAVQRCVTRTTNEIKRVVTSTTNEIKKVETNITNEINRVVTSTNKTIETFLDCLNPVVWFEKYFKWLNRRLSLSRYQAEY